MDNLKLKFANLKNQLWSAEEKDIKLRLGVKAALEAIFGPMATSGKLIGDFRLKNGNLFLNAKNKSSANELFFKKEEIKKKLQDILEIKEIIIK